MITLLAGSPFLSTAAIFRQPHSSRMTATPIPSGLPSRIPAIMASSFFWALSSWLGGVFFLIFGLLLIKKGLLGQFENNAKKRLPKTTFGILKDQSKQVNLNRLFSWVGQIVA